MNKNYIAALSLLCVSTSIHALNPVQGVYMGVMGGGTYTPSVNLNTGYNYDSFLNSEELKYKFGGNAGIALGYRCNQWRFEGQFLFNSNNYDEIQLQSAFGNFTISRNPNSNLLGLSLSGSTNLYALMFNGLYEFYTPGYDASFVPYLGAGIGYGRVTNKLTLISNNFFNNSISASDNSNEAVGQLIIGSSFFLDDFTSVGADYRYITTTNIKINGLNDRLQLHTINLNFNYAFDAGN